MLRDRIVGTWLLVSYVAQDDQGGPITFPLGRDSVGLIMYTTDGYMSAQLMRPGRQEYDQPDTGGSTVQQAATAAEGYLAYSGPYEVDETAGVIHHQVAVSLIPNWLDTVQLRHSSLEGNQLTLTAETQLPSTVVRSKLVWARAREHLNGLRVGR
jgi:Lipocalin-like domain